jgi:hypothetical protein
MFSLLMGPPVYVRVGAHGLALNRRGNRETQQLRLPRSRTHSAGSGDAENQKCDGHQYYTAGESCLNPKLKQLVDQIQNPELRQKVADFLENPTFNLDGKVYAGPSFDISLGGLSHHHTYVDLY